MGIIKSAIFSEEITEPPKKRLVIKTSDTYVVINAANEIREMTIDRNAIDGNSLCIQHGFCTTVITDRKWTIEDCETVLGEIANFLMDDVHASAKYDFSGSREVGTP